MSSETIPVLNNSLPIEDFADNQREDMLNAKLQEYQETLEKVSYRSHPDLCQLTNPKLFRGYALSRLIYDTKVDLAIEMLGMYAPEEIVMPKNTYYVYEHTMDNAARANSLELLKLLHEMSFGSCTVSAMDSAAAIGDLEMVRFLHENRTEGCSSRAFKKAKKYEHFEVLEYLEKNLPQGKKVSAPIRHGDFDPHTIVCTIQ